MSALERVQLQRDKGYLARTKFGVPLREVSALESVRLERVDCNYYYILFIFHCFFVIIIIIIIIIIFGNWESKQSMCSDWL